VQGIRPTGRARLVPAYDDGGLHFSGVKLFAPDRGQVVDLILPKFNPNSAVKRTSFPGDR
jgi:hypothetical protein